MDQKPSPDADRLMLDAKKAILQEQHRRFQELQREGRWNDAMQQLHTTLACAADLLKDSVTVLERAVARHQKKSSRSLPDWLPPNDPGLS